MCKLLILLIAVTSIQLSLQNSQDDYGDDKIKEYAQMASSFLKDQNADSIGGIISNLIQSEGGKQLGDMLMNMGNNKDANQILRGLGSIVGQNDEEGGGGFDPSIIGNVLSALGSLSDGKNKKSKENDAGDLLSMLGGLMGQEGGAENLMTMLPGVLSMINSFSKEEEPKQKFEEPKQQMEEPKQQIEEPKQQIEEPKKKTIEPSPSNEEWSYGEKIQDALDYSVNSEFGKSLMKYVGTEKFVKIFADKEGKFSLDKFLELLENHSFRKHWIELVTRKIVTFSSTFADPVSQESFLMTTQFFVNNFLKSQGFPKNTMFDPARPSETITALINYTFKKYLHVKINAKDYVKSSVKYMKDVVNHGRKQGYFSGRKAETAELSHKLADVINLEIIEPIARVYRAYRFIKKKPKCDKYVICLVSREQSDEDISLPHFKNTLSKYGSVVASWILSQTSGLSFWSLHDVITESGNCEMKFPKACNDFHLEEIKVTTEYVHNEL